MAKIEYEVRAWSVGASGQKSAPAAEVRVSDVDMTKHALAALFEDRPYVKTGVENGTMIIEIRRVETTTGFMRLTD